MGKYGTNMKNRILQVFAITSTMAVLISCGSEESAMPELSFEEALQEQLIQAQSGDVISIPAGVHEITRSLSLNVSGVTIAGEGMDASILSFKNQVQAISSFVIWRSRTRLAMP
jgi:uncharacterized protein YjlB